MIGGHRLFCSTYLMKGYLAVPLLLLLVEFTLQAQPTREKMPYGFEEDLGN